MTDKEKIKNIIELFIAWNGETDVIDVANIDSAVEFIVGSLQEESVSEGKDIFDNYLKSEERFILPQKISGNIDCENCLYSSACALGDIQACIVDKPVSGNFEMALAEMIDNAQKRVVEPWVVAAQWKDELIKLAKSEEPISEELNKAAIDYAESVDYRGFSNAPWNFVQDVFKAGANWQKEQLIKKAIDGTARPDDSEVWCDLKSFNLKDGDKVKVVVIKED